MNKWLGMGRLTAAPEVKYVPATPSDMCVASFTLAVDRRFKRDGEDTADFIRCKAFGKCAEFIEKYMDKGKKISVVGHIQTGSYTNKEGVKVYTTEIVLDEYPEFCESKKYADDEFHKYGNANSEPSDDFSAVEDDLPFA